MFAHVSSSNSWPLKWEYARALGPNKAPSLGNHRRRRPGLASLGQTMMGIPVGSDLEYADEVTMLKSLEGRREL